MIVHHENHVAGFAGNHVTYGAAQTMFVRQITITSIVAAQVLFPPHIADGATRCVRIDGADRRVRVDGATRIWRVDG